MLEQFSFNLFIITVLGSMGMVGTALYKQVRSVMGRGAVARLESRNEKTRRQLDVMEQQHQETKDQIAKADEERRHLHMNIADIKKKIKKAQDDNFVVIHEVGEPGGNNRLLLGNLMLGHTITIARNMTTESKLRGVHHILEVWAVDAGDANRLAKLAYPPDNGFTVQDIKVPKATANSVAAQ